MPRANRKARMSQFQKDGDCRQVILLIPTCFIESSLQKNVIQQNRYKGSLDLIHYAHFPQLSIFSMLDHI